ncbi:unnamed protein product [Rhizophagus irregularis]|nr:unnamed protein product [Rhizophagus irregularis]
MYKERNLYFISNLTNLNSELSQFQESDISSLSGLVLCSKNEKLRLDLPLLKNYGWIYLICKINVKKILSKDCSIKFILNNDHQEDYMLKHEVVSKLEELGWIEYQTPVYSPYNSQLSIEINSIEMQIDYIRFGSNANTITYIPDMSLMINLAIDVLLLMTNITETNAFSWNLNIETNGIIEACHHTILTIVAGSSLGHGFLTEDNMVVIPGTRKIKHLEENVEAVKVNLSYGMMVVNHNYWYIIITDNDNIFHLLYPIN